VRAPASFRPWQRVAILTLVFDPRTARPIPHRFDGGRWALGLLLSAAGIVLFVLASHLSDGRPAFGSLREWLRALTAAAGLYLVAEGSERIAAAGATLLGYSVPSLHRTPGRSRTLGEFWGQRWNRLVGAWLREHCYAPLARAGFSRLGTLAAFGASALIHVYPTALSVGAGPAAAMGAFFVVQGTMVVVESRVGARRWPAWLGHAYVITAFALTVPLFSEALLRSLRL
jgi:hypothetical protein